MLSFRFLKCLKIGMCSSWSPEAAVRGILGNNDSEYAKEIWDLYRTRPQSNLLSGVLDRFVMVFMKSLCKVIQESSQGESNFLYLFFFLYQSYQLDLKMCWKYVVMNIKHQEVWHYCILVNGIHGYAVAQFRLLPILTAATKCAVLEHKQN